MKIAIKGFLVMYVMMGLVLYGLQASMISHTRKQMAFAYHKALKVSMYSEDVAVFEEVFIQLAPTQLKYHIELVGMHEYPRLRRYKVVGTNDYLEFKFDETMIEERDYE